MENEERRHQLANECFVCGFTRAAYEDLGQGYSFETHVGKEHDLWSYLFFVLYLTRKGVIDALCRVCDL